MRVRRYLLAGVLTGTVLHAQEPRPDLLDPLSREEITATVATLTASQKMHAATRVARIALNEPPKAAVLSARSGGEPAPRTAAVVLYDWSTGITSTGVVDPERRTIMKWTELPSADPTVFYVAITRATEKLAAIQRIGACLRGVPIHGPSCHQWDGDPMGPMAAASQCRSTARARVVRRRIPRRQSRAIDPLSSVRLGNDRALWGSRIPELVPNG